MKLRFIIIGLLLSFCLFAETPVFPIVGDYYVTSGLGFRVNPLETGGQTGFHRGVDYSAKEGSIVLSCFTGVVIEHWPAPDGYYKGHPDFGGMIMVQDSMGITIYAHLSATEVHEGDIVTAGQMIGKVGSTGKSTGPHLHLERIVNIFGELE